MEIALVISSLNRGGAERVLTQVANHFARSEHTVTIFTLQAGATESAFTIDSRVRLQALECSPRGGSTLRKLYAFPRVIAALRRNVEVHRLGVVISFMDQTNLIVLWALSAIGVPIILCEHCNPQRNLILGRLPLARLFQRAASRVRDLIYQRAKAVVVLTDDMRGAYSTPLQKKIVVIPNPLEPAQESRPDLELHTPAILALGRLHPQKRFDRAISVFSRVAPAFPEWHLYIVGDGPLREALDDQAKSCAASGRIHLLGSTKTPRAILRQAEILLLSSDFEGFPLVLCEAMAEGRAVLATDCDYGPRSIVRNGVDGILVRVGDELELESNLAELMTDKGLRERLGKHAMESIQRFSASAVFRQWDKLIKSS